MQNVIFIEDHRGDGRHRSGFTESMLLAESRSSFDPLTRPTIAQDAQQIWSNRTKTPVISLTPESRPGSTGTAGYLSTAILHDLRNPLGTICAGAEMLIDLNCGPDQVKRLAVNIKRAARRMRELLAELTSFSRGKRPGAGGARFVVRLCLQRTESAADDGRRRRFEWEARAASAPDRHEPATG